MYKNVYIVNMMYYFVNENIFVVDKDKYNIASSVQISYQRIETAVYKF